MKKLIIATVLAVTSVFALAPASYAQSASVTISSGDGPRYYRDYDRDYDRERPRHYREHRRYVSDWQDSRRGCVTKKVRSYRHGAMVVKTTQVCR